VRMLCTLFHTECISLQLHHYHDIPLQKGCCLIHRSTTCRSASQRCAHDHGISLATAQVAQAASADAHS
jgi:hypothetical protein